MWKKENLRKNFNRVRQIAEQNLGRVEKSEVLSDDLISVEKRVELVRQVCQTTMKKMQMSVQGTGPDPEKRLKNVAGSKLGISMTESATQLGSDTLMGNLFQVCGECQINTARAQVQCELDMENEVIQPLQGILENDIPTIGKLKKHLNKVTLDMDSARNRWTTAVRQSSVHNTNMASAAAKAENIKDELEDSSNRVVQAKDALATELYNFVAHEAEHSQKLLCLLEAQATYHRAALETIEKAIPKMKSYIDHDPHKPVYGIPIEEHLQVTERDIALVIEACALTLFDTGMEEEGLFRIAGMASKVKKLKASFDAGIVDMEEYVHDVHTVAGALKQYLRQLPEPLLSFHLYNEYIQSAQFPFDEMLQALWVVTDKLPQANYNNFRYLIKFLAKLAERSDINKMTASNLAIVIGPNLLWTQEDNRATKLLTTGTLSAIIEAFISNADWFFPGELDFRLTGRGSAARLLQCGDSHIPPKLPIKHSPSFDRSVDDKYSPIARKDQNHCASKAIQSVSVNRTPSCNSPPISVSERAARCDRPEPTGSAAVRTKAASSSANPPNPIVVFDAQLAPKSSRSRSVPPVTPGKSFHSDVYSTVFALQTLGDGSWNDYLTKVRTMWDDHTHQADFREALGSNSSGVSGSLQVSQELDFGGTCSPAVSTVTAPFKNDSGVSINSNASTSTYQSMPSPTPSHDVTTTGGQQPSAGATVVGQQSPIIHHSPPVVSLSAGPPLDTDPSPKAPRRSTRKPAPPPPPERPTHTVTVTASTNQSMTWPRQMAPPSSDDGLSTEQSSTASLERGKVTPPERPQGPPPDRPAWPPQKRPEIPPPTAPHHHRSASTGSATIVSQLPSSDLQVDQSSSDGQGSTTVNESEKGATLTNSSEESSTNLNANRYGSARARPMPPLPPIANLSEDTQL